MCGSGFVLLVVPTTAINIHFILPSWHSVNYYTHLPSLFKIFTSKEWYELVFFFPSFLPVVLSPFSTIKQWKIIKASTNYTNTNPHRDLALMWTFDVKNVCAHINHLWLSAEITKRFVDDAIVKMASSVCCTVCICALKGRNENIQHFSPHQCGGENNSFGKLQSEHRVQNLFT